MVFLFSVGLSSSVSFDMHLAWSSVSVVAFVGLFASASAAGTELELSLCMSPPG